MKNVSTFLIYGSKYIACFSIAIVAMISPRYSHADVRINELMWMGSDLSTSDEWIELSASGSTDISGWKLLTQDSKGIEKMMVTFPKGTMVEDGAFLIIANQFGAKSRLSVAPSFLTTAVSLPNSGLHIRLRNESGSMMDEAGDGKGAPFAGANPSGGGAKASMERRKGANVGSDPASWQTARESKGWTTGSEIFGTPGFANSVENASSSTASRDSVTSAVTEVRITEIMPNPLGADTQEWIEIGNLGSEPVNIQGWTLSVEDASHIFHIESRSTDGFILAPDEHVAFYREKTGLILRNTKGASVVLRNSANGREDTLTYAETKEGVSIGRQPANRQNVGFLCTPSPNRPNTLDDVDVQILVQSGSLTGIGKTKVNFAAQVSEGKVSALQCAWDFGDGSRYTGCNPPLHTYALPGQYTVHLEAKTQCGTTVKRQLQVDVQSPIQDAILTREKVREKIVQTSLPSTCQPKDFYGVRISEILPNPEGSDKKREWIELQNTIDLPVNLCGWGIAYGTGKIASLDGRVIAPHTTLVLSGAILKYGLADAGSAVALLAPIRSLYSDFTIAQHESVSWRNIVSSLFYGKAGNDKAYAWSDIADEFLWTTHPTPAAENIFDSLHEEDDQPIRAILTGQVKQVVRSTIIDVVLDKSEKRLNRYNQIRVQLLDIDEPRNQRNIIQERESYKFVKALLENKKIELKIGSKKKNSKGMILAYMWLDGKMVQATLASKGLVYRQQSPENKRREEIVAAEKVAKLQKMGIWQDSHKSTQYAFLEEKYEWIAQKYGAENDQNNSSENLLINRAKIHISEIYSHANNDESGGDWVELSSDEDVPVSLSGWRLQTSVAKSARKYALVDSDVIPPHGYLVLRKERTKLALNNNGGTVYVMDGAGTVRFSQTFPKIKEGQSFARMGTRWCLTEKATPMTENICQKAVQTVKAVKAKKSTTKKKVTKKPMYSNALLKEVAARAAKQPSGEQVRTQTERQSSWRFFGIVFLALLPLLLASILTFTRRKEK